MTITRRASCHRIDQNAKPFWLSRDPANYASVSRLRVESKKRSRQTILVEFRSFQAMKSRIYVAVLLDNSVHKDNVHVDNTFAQRVF